MPKVSIIILNWNQPEFTVNCVKSVLKQSYQDFEILLVDNGSEDNSLEIFRKEFGKNEKIRILETGKNLGYAGGNNFGVKKARGEYVAILNNDTLVEENWLLELVTGLESDDKIGAVSSLEIREGKKKERDYRKIGITTSLLGYDVKYKCKDKLENPPLVNFFGIKGVSFIYRKNLVDLPFDPEYFIYAEDVYLGWLLRLKGYRNKLAHYAKPSIHHFHNITKKGSKKMGKYFVYLGERNRLINILIFYELKNLLKIVPLVLTGIVLFNLFEPRKFPYRSKSYLWILSHPQKILKKRKNIQKQRNISDSEIIKEMSYKFYEESEVDNYLLKKILCGINYLFYIYCKIMNLKTIEMK